MAKYSDVVGISFARAGPQVALTTGRLLSCGYSPPTDGLISSVCDNDNVCYHIVCSSIMYIF